MYDACWYDNGGSSYQAMDFQLTHAYGPLVLQGELYVGENCNPAAWDDQLNDAGTPYDFGTVGWIYWFTHRANVTDVSVIWSFSDTSGD